ncbi:MAG: dihydropteroate synthase [Deltaproteobacteria bacterium]|nr:dihydropteroate synthase [Deltaproteobacteria bacterium]MCL5791876.1 dihydropteroate synthase [Deltaproteobacteria bacterium]
MKKVYLINLLSRKEIITYFKSISVHTEGINIMDKKSLFYMFKINGLTSPAANILKQEALSSGAELATSWRVIVDSRAKTDAFLIGTLRQIDIISKKIKEQQFGLASISEELEQAIKNLLNNTARLKYKNHFFNLTGRPVIMGILNVTPDSFSDGGRFAFKDTAVKKALELVKEGADIIDIGGESTRPGAGPVNAEEEINRVIPVVKELRKHTKTTISIDTMKSAVALKALENGADIVNDVSAMRHDPAMIHVVKNYRSGIVLMHMRGTPRTMQTSIRYKDVLAEVLSFLDDRIKYAINSGIEKERIIIDPGIGFGKALSHNLLLLKNIRTFKTLGVPVLVGVSRKSFIGKITGAGVDQRLYGSLSSALWCITQGVDIIRVHDIKETKQAIDVIKGIMNA